MKKTNAKTERPSFRRVPVICDAEGCKAKALAGDDLCKKHRRQENSPPCSLKDEHGESVCRQPQYSLGLCEPHYRRKLRGSTRWNQSLNESRGELAYLATRVPEETRDVIASSTRPGQSLYMRHAEILEWVAQQLQRGAALAQAS